MHRIHQLGAEGIGVLVLHMPTIKPLDTQALDRFDTEHETIITLEQHQVAGGLGGAVSVLQRTRTKTAVSVLQRTRTKTYH